MKFRNPSLIRRLVSSHAGRIAMVAIPTGVVSAMLMGGVAQGAVPVSFAISGTQFKIASTQLDGTGFSQYSGVTKDARRRQALRRHREHQEREPGEPLPVCRAGNSPGKVGILIKAGGKGEPATAKDLQIGMTGLKGDAEFKNIRIGVDASDVNTKEKGSKGDFSQDADTVNIKDLKQDSWSTTASVFTLKDMSLKLTDGSEQCD
jgi:hypothetical protein